MKFDIWCLVGLLVFLVLLGTSQSQQQSSGHENENHHDNRDEPKVVTEFERKIWNVVANLYKGANNNTELENLIFSPLSLTNAMVMLNSGAGGETAREVQSLFQFGNNSELAIQHQMKILDSLKNQTLGKESGVKILSASRIFATKKNAKLRQNYVRAVSSLGEVETLDFHFTGPKPVVDEIDNWVRKQTDWEILNIAEDEDFYGEAAAVLLNTLYFKAPWKQPFNKNHTENADFHVSESKTEQVEMMHISAEFPYAELEQVEASAIFLPYKGGRFNMIIYLPNAGSNLSTLEEKLETLVPAQVRNKATTTLISLFLPKLNICSSLDFKQILTSLGVQKMFKREEADFSRMSESAQFRVSKVRQYVFIRLNEEGEPSPADTEVNGIESLAAPKTVKMDRPFIFQIYDRITGAVLLSGRISNPNDRGNEPAAMVIRCFGDGKNWDWNWIFEALFSTLVVMAIVAAIAFLVRTRKHSTRTFATTSQEKNNFL